MTTLIPHNKPISQAEAMKAVVTTLTGPLAFSEFVERVLALWPSKAKNPASSIRNELAYSTSRYGIVYLDQMRQMIIPLAVGLKGIRFRHPVTALEVEKGTLIVDPSLLSLLGYRFFRESDIVTRFQFVDSTQQPLPSKPTTLPYQADTLFGRQKVEVPGFVLDAWFQQQQIAAGDAVLLTVNDWDDLRFELEHEPAAKRQDRVINERNRALVDQLYQLLEQATVERLQISDAVPLAYMRMPDPQGYPGDPWLTVVVADGRMSAYGTDIRYATADDHFLNSLLGEDLPTAVEAQTALSVEAAQHIYRFKCELKHRKGLWRVIEIRGEDTLDSFNRILVTAFNHDFAHLGGFRKLVRRGNTKRFREIDLGSVDPFGAGEAADVQIASIGLEPGDRMKYVFDFGDWIEHTLILDEIFTPEQVDTTEDLPRVVAQNRVRYRYCTSCKEQNQQSVAVYLCIDCSDQVQTEVYLCEACAEEFHEDHYVEEILY